MLWKRVQTTWGVGEAIRRNLSLVNEPAVFSTCILGGELGPDRHAR